MKKSTINATAYGDCINKRVSITDQDDNNTNIIPGQWRNVNPVKEGLSKLSLKFTLVEAKNQFEYLRAYFSSDARSVCWPNDMI
ncbi:hypothetical protein DPMN_172978 [Dreissena polymorpha]|uniref:Uncharacterized protein n=1 Tax=Dreissena polymorpha TaxID=45954 RepID=A0A9D4IGJ1_DREPO|nr:hypothetical protein DPMN_172978 [Dreissena polymorpha]